MENEFIPSYANYEKIMEAVKMTGKAMDYREAETAEEFIVIRHDIEFDLRPAVIMAEIEQENGLRASYFIQLENDAYNPFSDESKELVMEIMGFGHEIGLHYRMSGHDTPEEIKRQAELMEQEYGVLIDRFSIHRPQKETAYERLEVEGLINTYSEKFFDRTENPEQARIKYIADSKFRWNYGFPDYKTLIENRKVQLLTHPFQWSDGGRDMAETFSQLIETKKIALTHTFFKEFSRYEEIWKEVKL